MTELSLYEEQLLQIQSALITCDNEDDRKNLQSLENDLKELINLSFLQSLEEKADEGASSSSDEDKKIDEAKTSQRHLINQKCRAPFHINGQTHETFHNGFIASVDGKTLGGDVMVKIFFLNPTVDLMKPCEYFFSGRCTYEENCKFSHGESVEFTKLKPYYDPDYSLLKTKTHVLVKTDSLWKPGIIVECSQDTKTCQVKLHSGKTFECPFSDILPPIESDSDSDSSDLSTDDESDMEDFSVQNVFQVDENFGDWQKYTRGIGSKIMEKLGYQFGKGLGKRSDGISEPISARIYIQGKSLDFNIEQREKKGQKTVEEKIKSDSLKQQKISEKNYGQPQGDVFTFINNIYNTKPTSSSVAKKDADLKKQTKTQLNLSNFKTEEEIKKVEKSLKNLRESHRRHKQDSIAFKNIKRQIESKQEELAELQKKLSDVNREQRTRNDNSKLTIF